MPLDIAGNYREHLVITIKHPLLKKVSAKREMDELLY